MKLIDRGLYYSFLDKEVKIKAIIIIKRKSTISLLNNKFKLSKLYSMYTKKHDNIILNIFFNKNNIFRDIKLFL